MSVWLRIALGLAAFGLPCAEITRDGRVMAGLLPRRGEAANEPRLPWSDR